MSGKPAIAPSNGVTATSEGLCFRSRNHRPDTLPTMGKLHRTHFQCQNFCSEAKVGGIIGINGVMSGEP